MKTNLQKILKGTFAFLVIAAVLLTYIVYNQVYSNNVKLNGKKTFYLFIATGSNFNAVLDTLSVHKILLNEKSFIRVAELKKYVKKIKPGRYEIKSGMSNNEILNMLRVGNQKPINLIFNSIRTKGELAGKIANQLEFDSLSLITLLNDKNYLKSLGFDPNTVISMFIPNTYQMVWNTTADKFVTRMNREYNKFWTPEREKKLKSLKMNKLQVSTLASIVQAEQSVRNDEKPKVAGLYINRLRKRMLLESDPTIVYAIGDFSIRRVLNRDKEIESPYNTYKYAGLPPGPINLPEISSIDAVLNYENHNYIFMCAKDDFSGYHYFSDNLSQHNIYARRYQIALNNRDIKR
ncbi:MAG: endolytic transglycosylase MltG [Bacteroidales bacterium]